MEIRYYRGLPEYKNLEEILLPPYTEPKIANLVRALISIRLDPWYSCEGHLSYKREHQHPFISFNPFSVTKVAALKYLVEGYNKDHEIKWKVVEEKCLIPSTYEELFKCCDERRKGRISRKKLERLQQSADELAHHIFDNRTDENIRKLILVYGL
jgi:hypothetical protein|uniref:Uncharacterized protein n=1 Tax=Dictyoglomus turgidum TaxID=513050 RepID=A0A7C3SN36_9BACT